MIRDLMLVVLSHLSAQELYEFRAAQLLCDPFCEHEIHVRVHGHSLETQRHEFMVPNQARHLEFAIVHQQVTMCFEGRGCGTC